MLKGNQASVEPQAAPMDGVKGAYIQWLIAKPEGAENFYMRRIIVKQGGVIPEHAHPEQHEIFILSGEGEAVSPGGVESMKPGDFLYIPGGEKHSFKNVGQGELTFICCINVT